MVVGNLFMAVEVMVDKMPLLKDGAQQFFPDGVSEDFCLIEQEIGENPGDVANAVFLNLGTDPADATSNRIAFYPVYPVLEGVLRIALFTCQSVAGRQQWQKELSMHFPHGADVARAMGGGVIQASIKLQWPVPAGVVVSEPVDALIIRRFREQV